MRPPSAAEAPSCKIGWIRVPGGAVIEIFGFEPQQPPIPVPWNRVGLTHICFNVRNIQRWYDYLVGKGVECLGPPERSPRGHTLFFAKDPDGNLIELTDLGYMHYVLAWLGPLGGMLFRRGMYKQYCGDGRAGCFASARHVALKCRRLVASGRRSEAAHNDGNQ
ncbi:MAG: VOC family protein [Acidobacteria bacterium]|nr:VOC family protein [Acidobacteriota bacterium]